MGGGDGRENLVYLTGEEHYVAHQLLVRMNPDHAGLIYAALLMSKQSTGNKAYGWLRRRYSIAMSGTQRNLGTKYSAETRAKMSTERMGKKYPGRKTGIVFTPEHRANLSASRKGKKRPPEVAAKIAESLRGRVVSAETRAKLSIARRKRVTSEATRSKMSASRLGKRLGPRPAELRAKLSAISRAAWASGTGQHQWTMRKLKNAGDHDKSDNPDHDPAV